MPEDPVEQLLSQPIKLQRTQSPVLSDTVLDRRANPPTYTPSQKLPYMTYDKLMSGSNDLYSPLDFPVVGQRIRDNVVKAIESRFPVVGENYTIKVENVRYEKPKDTELREEKEVLLNEGTLQDRLKGDWVLYDNKTGKELQRKATTLLNVPRMTDRGTFIRNGSEIGLKHMFRLRSGVYTHIKNNGQVSAHINPEQTTGQQMSLDLDQATGVFSLSRGTRTYGLLPMLKAAGVPDEVVKKALGEELYKVNYDKYKRMLDKDNPTQAEYKQLWDEKIAPMKLDPETTESTLGKAFDKMDPDVLLRASNRVLQVSRTMSDLDTDDRDSLRYQRIMGPADYIPERIVRDGGGLLRKLFNRIEKTGNLDEVQTGTFQPQVDSVFLDDKHAGYIDGSSPLESMDFATMVSRLGEGGIGDLRAAPAETRAVNDSYLNFVDSVRSPESLKVGLDIFLSYGVMKDSAGNLYNRFKDKTGKVVTVPMNVAASSIIATPEFWDPKASPEEFIPAMYQGKGIEYVKRKDVDFYVDNSNRMMSVGAGMIPLIGGIRSNRTLMGCLDPETEVVTVAFNYIEPGAVELDISAITADGLRLGKCNKDPDIYVISMDLGKPCLRKIKGIRKVTENRGLYKVTTDTGAFCKVNSTHKWRCKVLDPETVTKDTISLLTTAQIKDLIDNGKRVTIPAINPKYHYLDDVLLKDIITSTYGPGIIEDTLIKSIEPAGEAEYLVDIDVDDHVYLLANGMFTHNSKYGNQAVPLTHGEAPLVQRKLTLDSGEESTTERFIGRQLGARFSPVDGIVTNVDKDFVTIRGRDGEKHRIDLYNDYPANQKGYITSRTLVKPGDRVKTNQILAATNYTDDEGTAALGTNLRVAFLTGRNAGTFEDSIQVSETAAKTKLASTQLYKVRGETTKDIEYNKQRYLSLFKDDFTPEQLAKIDDNGLPKPGTVFEQGDPMYLGVQTREIGVHGLAKNAAVPYVTRWEHEDPGTVTNVVQGRKHMTIYTKCVTPMKVGDKLCFDDKTQILTDKGWKYFKDLNDTERVLTLDLYTGDTRLTAYSEQFSYDYKGKMYSLENEYLSICVTPDHDNIVTANTSINYVQKMKSKEVFGKTVFYITGENVFNPHNFKPSKTKKTKEEWIDYDGRVYCVTVPQTHNVFVRRNGKPWWSGNSSRFGSKGVLGCYDSTTYVFTKGEGFKLFSDLKETDEVATLDPVTNTAHFEVPKAIQVYDYEGEMYGYDDRYLNWLVTPNHNMWATSRHNDHKRHPEEALFHRVNIQKVHGKGWKHTISADFPDVENPIEYVTIPSCENAPHAKNINTTFRVADFARFLGIWLAEGNISGSCATRDNHYVIITQKDDPADPSSIDRCNKISSLLDRMGFYWSKQGIKYCISHKALFNYLKQFGHAADKYIPEEVFTSWPKSAKEALFEYMYMGDGDKRGTNDLRYATCSPRLRDCLVRLCTILGYRANWVKARDKGFDTTGKKCDALYRISITRSRVATSKSYTKRTIHKGYYKEQYSGKVYCCTVSTGVILVQRNGRCMWCGNSIIPDDQMPRDANGVPFDVLQSPLGVPSRLNTSMLAELQLAKIAKKTGKTYALPDFMDESIIDYVDKEMKANGVEPDEDIYDPVTGKTIPNVQTGTLFFYKLKHMAELKGRSRSTGTYSSEDVPLKGEGQARRFGAMETSALYGGGGMEVLRDAKIVRGQRNDEFWRDYRSGKYPETPGFPLVHQKFFAHLKAAGINLEDRGDRIHIYGATEQNLRKLTGDRQVTKAATYDSKDLRPVAGGFFDPTIFGTDGDQWGYVEFPEPVLNPMMFKPIGAILGWKDKELSEYLSGERKLDGKFGSKNLIETLNKLDLPRELAKAKQVLKSQSTTLEQRDLARKRIRAIEPMLREGKRPEDFFVTRMPILPPKFRPVTEMSNGVGIAADVNFLYKRMMDSIDDLVQAKKELPEELQLDARRELYNSVNAVTGLEPTDDPKLSAKGVAGVLKWAFGKGSPKLGSLNRKVFGSNLDLGAINVITPDNSLTIDQVGVPELTAWKMFEPFVVRKLVQGGASVINAMKEVLDQTPEARRALVDVMKTRPILINRAPTLWRYGIQGQYPILVKGNSLHINPNICNVMAADYDGDQMSTHVPVSQEAIEAIDKHMLPSRNLLSPVDDTAHFIPRSEFAEGLYLASRTRNNAPIRFRSKEDMMAALKKGEIKIDTPVIIG